MPISNLVIPRLLQNIRMLNKYTEQEIDMIRYSLQTILWETEKILILAITFALLRHLDYFGVTMVVLLTLRTNAGGYHSNSGLGCLLWTFLMFALSILILPLYNLPVAGMIIVSVLSLLITAYAAPVYHIQREHLLKHKAKKGKWIAFGITLLWILVIFIFQNNTYAQPALWVMLLQNLQLLFEFVRRKKYRKESSL